MLDPKSFDLEPPFDFFYVYSSSSIFYSFKWLPNWRSYKFLVFKLKFERG